MEEGGGGSPVGVRGDGTERKSGRALGRKNLGYLLPTMLPDILRVLNLSFSPLYHQFSQQLLFLAFRKPIPCIFLSTEQVKRK